MKTCNWVLIINSKLKAFYQLMKIALDILVQQPTLKTQAKLFKWTLPTKNSQTDWKITRFLKIRFRNNYRQNSNSWNSLMYHHKHRIAKFPQISEWNIWRLVNIIIHKMMRSSTNCSTVNKSLTELTFIVWMFLMTDTISKKRAFCILTDSLWKFVFLKTIVIFSSNTLIHKDVIWLVQIFITFLNFFFIYSSSAISKDFLCCLL